MECAGNGQPSAYPSLKACHHCLENGIQCVKIVMLVWACDSEVNNWKAMKCIKEAKESGEIDGNLALLNACPNVVHIGKASQVTCKLVALGWFLFKVQPYNPAYPS